MNKNQLFKNHYCHSTHFIFITFFLRFCIFVFKRQIEQNSSYGTENLRQELFVDIFVI